MDGKKDKHKEKEKVKDKLVGRFRLRGPCSSVVNGLVDESRLSILKPYDYYCSVSWLKDYSYSKSKLPSDFSSIFHQKEGFKSLNVFLGFKLKDLL